MNAWFGHNPSMTNALCCNRGVIRWTFRSVNMAKPGRTHSGYMKETR